jgi:hypothetical protein
MKAIWTGNELIMKFVCGGQIGLNLEQTKEFEIWVLERVNKAKVEEVQ